jgi:hypothetical protein
LIVKMREIVPTYSPWQAIPQTRSAEDEAVLVVGSPGD